VTQHYFSDSPAGELSSREIEVPLGGATRRVLTAGGVFSAEQLDRGTEVLLRALAADVDEDAGPRILDLGCGWGPIALDAALRMPAAEVWAVDVNPRARELAARNAERLGLGNVRVAAPDDVPPTLRFSEIRSNPPIRVGKQVLHDMLRHWLGRLTGEGAASLVVAKHLGAESLQRWLAAEFPGLEVSRIRRDRGFHVIRAARAPAQGSSIVPE